MAKKRRKKTGKGFGGIGPFFKTSGRAFFKIFPFFVVIAAAGLLFLGVREALYADLNLSIQNIAVEPAGAISNVRHQQLESKFLGKNILQVDLKRIAGELEKNPEIQTARVTRILPNILKIVIESRRPAALIRFSPRGSLGLISEDGMILDVLPEKTASLLLIEAFDAGMTEPKIGYQVKNMGFSEAMRFVQVFWNHPMARRETVTKLGLDHFGNVTAVFGSEPEVRLGRKPSERLAALEKIVPLLEKEDRSKIDYVDLQYDNVIVKRKR